MIATYQYSLGEDCLSLTIFQLYLPNDRLCYDYSISKLAMKIVVLFQ